MVGQVEDPMKGLIMVMMIVMVTAAKLGKTDLAALHKSYRHQIDHVRM